MEREFSRGKTARCCGGGSAQLLWPLGMSSKLLTPGKTQSRLLGKFSRSVMSMPHPQAAGGPLGQGKRAPVQSVHVGNSRRRKLSALKPHGLGGHRENVPRPGFPRDMGRLAPLAGRKNTGGMPEGCQGIAEGCRKMPESCWGMPEGCGGYRGTPGGFRGAPSYLSCPRRSVPARRGAGCGPG